MRIGNQIMAVEPGQTLPGLTGRSEIKRRTVVNTGGGAYVGGSVNVDGGASFYGRDKYENKAADFQFPVIDSSTFPPNEIWQRRDVYGTVIIDNKGREFIFVGKDKTGDYLYVTRSFADAYAKEHGGIPMNALYSKAFTGNTMHAGENVRYKIKMDANNNPVQTERGYMYLPVEENEDDWK